MLMLSPGATPAQLVGYLLPQTLRQLLTVEQSAAEQGDRELPATPAGSDAAVSAACSFSRSATCLRTWSPADTHVSFTCLNYRCHSSSVTGMPAEPTAVHVRAAASGDGG